MSGKLTIIDSKYSHEWSVIEAKQILEKAIEKKYETVIVFGFNGEDIDISSSSAKRALEIVGALEVAKIEFWKEE